MCVYDFDDDYLRTDNLACRIWRSILLVFVHKNAGWADDVLQHFVTNELHSAAC